MSGIVDDLLGSIDSILSVRDNIGAVLKPVYMVTRTWTGSEAGDGTSSDVSTRVLPSPSIREFQDEYGLQEGGAVRIGDVLVKMISKHSYPNRSDVDGSSDSANVERFYRVGDQLYRVINVREKYLTWNVLVRQVNE